jgi:hypothetical protein
MPLEGDVTEPDEGQEPETEGTEEDPRIKKANQEAATYRRELRTTQAELKKIREASQTESEKAVAEAEERGKAAGRTEGASRLVKAEFRAAAAGRVDKQALDGFLEYVDPMKFVGDDGEPDEKAIEAAIAKLAPKTEPAVGRLVRDLKPGALAAGDGTTLGGSPSAQIDAHIRRMAGIQ